MISYMKNRGWVIICGSFNLSLLLMVTEIWNPRKNRFMWKMNLHNGIYRISISIPKVLLIVFLHNITFLVFLTQNLLTHIVMASGILVWVRVIRVKSTCHVEITSHFRRGWCFFALLIVKWSCSYFTMSIPHGITI